MELTLSNSIGRLRILAIMEGVSYILFGITMPLKYMMGIPEPNYVVGMAHGVLFILYCLQVFQVGIQKKITFGQMILFWIASLIPFGTFYIDYKYLRK